MLPDEQLLAAYHDAKAAGANHFGSLRAVEAAVRADERKSQIAKDAVVAEAALRSYDYSPNRHDAAVHVKAAIRAQLTEGDTDE